MLCNYADVLMKDNSKQRNAALQRNNLFQGLKDGKHTLRVWWINSVKSLVPAKQSYSEIGTPFVSPLSKPSHALWMDF